MLKKGFWGFFILGLFGAAHVALFFFNPPFPKSRVKKEKQVDIAEGASFSAVSGLLAEHQLIRNRFYFRVMGKLTGKDTSIRPGHYTLNTAMRPTEILDQLISGRGINTDVTVRIRRGLTSTAIALLLEQEGVVSVSEFLDAVYDPTLLEMFGIPADNFEGYLFPDTYMFTKGSDPSKIVRKMVETFESRFRPEWQEQAQQIGLTKHETVILASIVEKEISLPFEASLVSAVFHNRLRQGMRLQSDPTVIYGIKDFNGNLTRSDLMTYTPYNTYRIDGLPPGPIGSPGEDALQATVFPDPVNYLYFVSMNNGRHKFSETLEEHNAAVNLFQRGTPEREMFDD